MLYRFIKKFKKVICSIIIFCVTLPLVSACGETENYLKNSVKNVVVGVGSNIDGYTTYSQAKLMQMDKDMYYSYLVSMRDFILVVLPEGKDKNGKDTEYPVNENFMFQAIYNGVTPYAKEIINGNFSFESPEYKLLIYYVLADDFLQWEKEANQEADKGFLGSALDFLGPSSADNYELNWNKTNEYATFVNAKVVRNEEEYNLKNVVNRNKYVSECDFLRVDDAYNIADYDEAKDTTALTKCGTDNTAPTKPKGKNVIADVARGVSEGVTLLFGSGGLSGYFTDKDLEGYNFENSEWITELIEPYDGSMEKYAEHVIRDNLCSMNSSFCSSSGIYSLTGSIKQMVYKLKYDMALFGRIRRINYNTLLDINASNSVTTGLSPIGSIDEYATVFQGSKDYNDGNYVSFTAAEGFTIDRGNIVMQGGQDFIFNTNFLELMTQMDACTNRTIASYVAEALSTVGIVVGGVAVGVGAAVLAYTAVATAINSSMAMTILTAAGASSLSVPGPGWIIGCVLLVAAGALALYYGISTKKAINETDSANFCKVYEKALDQIIETSFIKLPIYSYTIPEDANYSTELCYASYVMDPSDNVMKCGSINKNTGAFEPSTLSVDAFKMADVGQVKKLQGLSGAPVLRLYSNGSPIDEIYGAASPQYIYAIMDSWGITSATSMKYYTQLNEDKTSISIYDLLYTSAERETKIKSASYCATIDYGASCSGSNAVGFGLSYDGFTNGVKTMGIDQKVINQANEIETHQLDALKDKYGVKDIEEYKSKFTKIASYMNIPVSGNMVYLNGSGYEIDTSGALMVLRNGTNVIEVANGEFIHDGLVFNVTSQGGTYVFQCAETNLYRVVDELGGRFNGAADTILDNFATAYLQEYIVNKSSDGVRNLIDGLDGQLHGLHYSSVVVPIYITLNIVEEDKDKNEILSAPSVVYKEISIELVYGEEN